MSTEQEEKARDRISKIHPNITWGGKYRYLKDDEVLQPTDETVCISMLFRLAGWENWSTLDTEEWTSSIGKTVKDALAEDADEYERIFRRKV